MAMANCSEIRVEMHCTGYIRLSSKSGIRIVYALIQMENEMLVIIIGTRANDEVYDFAAKRYIRMRKDEKIELQR